MSILSGSVSHGTMREEDLIPRFLDTLADLAGIADTIRSPEQERVGTIVADIEARSEEEGYYDSENAGYDLETLFDELNTLAPEGCYFGAHPGDGADYGFWACE